MAKTLFTRISQKHDLEVNWLAHPIVPLQGELIIYDIEIDSAGQALTLPEGRTEPYTYARVKIGDGINTTTDLPFIDEMLNSQIAAKSSVQIVTWGADD